MTPSSFSPPSATACIGIIGLGLVGSELARRLLEGGLAVVGCDLNPARMEELTARGGTVADAPRIFERCDRVILSLPSHREVEALIDLCSASLRSGLIIIDTTTGDPASSESLASKLAARDVVYLDATISGSSAHVREGTAVIMVGGSTHAINACGDIFSRVSRQSFHTGGPGTGAKMKLVTNLVLGLNRAAMAEGLALAEAMGLDAVQTLAVMRGSAAYSRIMDTKGEKMIHRDFSAEARLSQHLKDVRLIVAAGQQAGLPMPLSVAHAAILSQAEAEGLGALDNSALIEVLRLKRKSQE